MRAYLDTSAAAKLLVEEPESTGLADWADDPAVELVACQLLETELRRFAERHELPQADVTAILDRVSLHAMPPALYREAGLLPGRAVRTLDAIHLAAAIRAEADTVVTYDERLALGAETLGVPVLAPG